MNCKIADIENNSKVQSNNLPSFSFLSLKSQNAFNPITPMSNNSQLHKRLSFTPSEHPSLNFFNKEGLANNESPIRKSLKKASIISSKSGAGSSLHHRSQLSSLLKRQFTMDQSQQSPLKAALTPKEMLSKFSKSFKEKTPIMSSRSSRRGLTQKHSFILDNSFTSAITDQSCDVSLKRQSTKILDKIQDSSPKKMSNLIRRKSCHCSDCGGLSKKERNNINLPLPCPRVMQTSTIAQSWFLENLMNPENPGFFTPTAGQRKFKQKESRFKEIGSKAMIALKFTHLSSKNGKSQESQKSLTVKDPEENLESQNLSQSMTSEWRKSITSSSSPKKDPLDTFASRKLQELLKPVLSSKGKTSLQDLHEGKSNREDFTASIDLDVPCSKNGNNSNDTDKKKSLNDLPFQSNSKFRGSFKSKGRKILRKNASIDEKMVSGDNIFDTEQKIVIPQSTNYISSEQPQHSKPNSRPKTSSIGPSGRKFAARSRSKTSKFQKTISIQEIYNTKPVITKPSTAKSWKVSHDDDVHHLASKINLNRNTSSQIKSKNFIQTTESMPNIEIKISLAPDFLEPPVIVIKDGLSFSKGQDQTDLFQGQSLTCLETKPQKENQNPRKKSRKLKTAKTELITSEKEVLKEKVILKSSSKKGIKTFFLGELKKIYKPRLDRDRQKSFKAF